MTTDLRRKRYRLRSAAVAGLVAASALSAAPAFASPDSWHSERDIYQVFTVPKAASPSQTCGNSTGLGTEIAGNFGPAKTWSTMGLDPSGANCVATIGPLEPGLYYYEYNAMMADRSKVAFRDPDSSNDVTSHPEWNTLFIPGPEVAWMDDVATGGGTVSELAYDAGDAEHTAVVWTPPSYTEKKAHALPVLYLLADEGQSAQEWLELGRAAQVLDNLAIDGDLAPMVVVMADVDDAAEVTNDLAPAVRDAYNVSSKVKQTGVAGIGEGAAQALELSLSEPGVYGSVGSFSGYLTESVTSKQAKKINAKTDLLRFYVGNVLDSNYNATFDAVQQLSDAGVRLESDGVTPGTGGVWDTWRENLRDFASRAFQPGVRDSGPSNGHLAQTERYTAPEAGSITRPDIDENGIVTFETGTQWANAKDVTIWGNWAPNGQWFRIPMEKVGDRWRLQAGPLDGYYYWRYMVDGVAFHDPQDTQNIENVESQLFIPGGERTPLLADVPADQTGDVQTHTYTGSSKLKVWTPVDYDADRAEPYPVLYLYHGFAQNYASWTEVGRAAQILDNLYARGEIEPMVVVMPGYAGAPGDIWGDLSGNVMPYVGEHYNVSEEPTERALAGLSWGGRLTHGTMVNHPGNFAHYGMFSPPFATGSIDPATEAGQTAIATTESVTLYSGDLDTGAISAIDGMESNLAANGIPVTKTVIPGPHGFDVWWAGLSAFLPTLF